MILKYLNYRKLKLLTLLWLSYHLSNFLKKNIRWGKYIALSIEPTNTCNLSCLECPTGTNNLTRKVGSFSLDAFKRLLEEKARDLIYLNFYFQGEPFLNKQTTQMIKLASDKNIYTSTSTNAQLIDKELASNIVKSGLNRIILSIDGTTQDIYKRYRKGGELDLVIQATKYIINAKKEIKKSYPKIVFQFLVFKHNEHQINDIKQLGKKLGVDAVEIKTAQMYNYQNSNNITSIDKYSRYKKGNDGKYQIKNNFPNKCWRMWHSAVITHDLDLVPCCYDKDANHSLGNLNNASIINIENSEKYKTFRQKIIDERFSISMCKNCDEGLNL